MVRLPRLFLSCVLLLAPCWPQSSGNVQQPGANELQPSTTKEVTQPDAQLGTKAVPESSTNEAAQPSKIRLTAVETFVSKSETAIGFSELSCDGDGNLYLGVASQGDAIRKINSKGELLASFKPAANPDIEVYGVGRYSVTPDGELYIWVGSKTEIARYLLVFKPDWQL